MRDKPKVERAVRYVRGNVFVGEHFTGLADAQARAEAWCRNVAPRRGLPPYFSMQTVTGRRAV